MATTTAVAAPAAAARAGIPRHAGWPGRNFTQLRPTQPRRSSRACCPIRRMPPIRWTIRRLRLPPLPVSFPCLRSTRDTSPISGTADAAWSHHRSRRLRRPPWSGRTDESVERAGRHAAARVSRPPPPVEQAPAGRGAAPAAARSISRSVAIQFNRRPPATRHAHNNARN